MNRIKAELDSIIIQIKKNKAFDGVRFVREYNAAQIETPVSGLIAVVCLTGASLSKSYVGGYITPSAKGEVYRAEVEIRLYAPSDESGGGLTEPAGALAAALKELEHEGVGDVSVSAIGFDADAAAVYRRVSFKFALFSGTEAADE